ncbi:RsmB/NOP family class I SAM-dependent RNA methyltransferase [Candidatus Amarolinea dominans]|uniref:RsmB/NOP family class I SAM-dependent RNA methyltransferase n=1 Tax=Candidatus Amarolinea dominans TaxID=3140696 RepID=UPI0031CCC310
MKKHEINPAHTETRFLAENGFLTALAPLLGAERDAFEATYAQPPTIGLRVNTLKLAAAALRDRLTPLALAPVPWCAAGFCIDASAASPADFSLGKSPLHAAGLYYLQEPSAMAVAEVLAPQPGERVLDLCAAPGGKSTHLAALMQNQGLLVANETVPGRAAIVAENLERWGARHAIITSETPARLAARWPGFFDRVLVDAPCSGEGMFRRLLADGARVEWSAGQVAGCALRQMDILAAAALLLRPGGILVYSTCTFNLDENERVIARFLQSHSDFELAALPVVPGWAPGLGPLAGQPGVARLWPHRVAGEGHFLALLQRRPTTETPPPTRRALSAGRPGRAAQRAWETFCAANLVAEPPGTLLQTGTYLYQAPEPTLDLAGLRVLRPGWWLGEGRGERLEPSHALALGLTQADFQRTLDLEPDDPAVMAYLHGEALTAPGAAGWLAVCVDSFPLGWGKRSGGTVKNHYPKGLRVTGASHK